MQYKISANLASSGFPMTSRLQGRTVLVGRLDQSKVDASNSSTNNNLIGKETGAPEAYYMHNVLPTVNGYKSIGFHNIIASHTGEEFIAIVDIRNEVEALSFLASTASGKYFLYDLTLRVWKDVTPVGAVLAEMTVGFAAGVTYICLAGFDVVTVNLDTLELESAVLLGVTNSGIKGIASSNNYLLLHDGQSIFWSSSLSATDFVPSLTTGAGSGIPTALKGEIVALSELSTGFAVYSRVNISIAGYSGNVRFPWIFKEAQGGAGIKATSDVSYAGDSGTNYAWTSAGLLRIAQSGATAILPEITDFLASRVFEDFDSGSGRLNSEFLSSKLLVRVLYVSTRYLMISYGKTSYTHVLVYDTALKRLGKLKLDHVMAFELTKRMDFLFTPYSGLAPMTYGDLSAHSAKTVTLFNPTLSEDVAPSAASTAEPKRTIAFLLSDGSVQVTSFDEGDFSADSALILGKYQLTRSRLSAMQEVELECIDEANSSLSLKIMTSLTGRRPQYPLIEPFVTLNQDGIRRYLSDPVGINHSLLIQGSFHLVSTVFTLTQHGKL